MHSQGGPTLTWGDCDNGDALGGGVPPAVNGIKQREHSGAEGHWEGSRAGCSWVNPADASYRSRGPMVLWASPVRTRWADRFHGDGGKAPPTGLQVVWMSFKCSA